jgi:ribosomal protein L10
MNRTRIGLAACTSVAALALGAGTALAAHGHHGKAHAVRAAKAAAGLARTKKAAAVHGHGDLKAAAGYLGLTVAQLRADLKAGQTLAQVADATPGKSADDLVQVLVAAAKTKLDALVAAGKLTQAQETTLLAKLQTRIEAAVSKARPAVRAAATKLFAAGLKAAADYLGVPAAQLRTDLKNGQTLAQVANATPGKSADGLVQALVAAAKSKLDAAVAAGKLTAAQESQVLSRLTTLVTAAVNG